MALKSMADPYIILMDTAVTCHMVPYMSLDAALTCTKQFIDPIEHIDDDPC